MKTRTFDNTTSERTHTETPTTKRQAHHSRAETKTARPAHSLRQTTGRRRFFNSKKLCEIEVVPEVLPEVTEDALQKALGPEHVSVSADEARLHLHVRAERLG